MLLKSSFIILNSLYFCRHFNQIWSFSKKAKEWASIAAKLSIQECPSHNRTKTYGINHPGRHLRKSKNSTVLGFESHRWGEAPFYHRGWAAWNLLCGVLARFILIKSCLRRMDLTSLHVPLNGHLENACATSMPEAKRWCSQLRRKPIQVRPITLAIATCQMEQIEFVFLRWLVGALNSVLVALLIKAVKGNLFSREPETQISLQMTPHSCGGCTKKLISVLHQSAFQYMSRILTLKMKAKLISKFDFFVSRWKDNLKFLLKFGWIGFKLYFFKNNKLLNIQLLLF